MNDELELSIEAEFPNKENAQTFFEMVSRGEAMVWRRGESPKEGNWFLVIGKTSKTSCLMNVISFTS